MDAFEQAYYEYRLRAGLPYFGPVLYARLGLMTRHAYMRAMAADYCRKKRDDRVRVLEIGSWAGGSALTWARALVESGLKDALVLCLDSWVPYFDPRDFGNDKVYADMDRSLKEGTLFDLFLHNVETSGFRDLIVPIRGTSAKTLPLLAESSFDIVFVDGGHGYANVKNDLALCRPLVAEGGILCGDDLELQASEIDRDFARKSLEEDYIRDPKTGKDYHPGVAMAVGDTFGDVSVREGFWAMRKRGTGWEALSLPEIADPASSIPEHLREPGPSEYLAFAEERFAALDLRMASQAYLKVITRDPTAITAYLKASEALSRLDQRDLAMQVLDACLKINPEQPEAKSALRALQLKAA
jgi:predicted O-methyltransferase YrrM